MIVLTGNVSRPKGSTYFDSRDDMGMMLSPSGWRYPHCRLYACDNDVYGAWKRGEGPGWWKRDGEAAWLRMLDKIPQEHKPLFVILPDAVGDWPTTIERAWFYLPELRDRGLSVALALQDGAVLEAAAMLYPHWFFVGGTTAWKWANAERIVKWGHASFGIKTHVGRAGGVNRVRECLRIGADSCDGSQWLTFSRAVMPGLTAVLDRREAQMRLSLASNFMEAV